MSDEPEQPPEEEVDAEILTAEDEIREAVENATGSAALTLADPQDRHEGFVAMDANDAKRFIDRLTRQTQEGHLAKRWVYQLPYGAGEGLTGDAVEDITQQMNWTGQCAIGIMPETLRVELIDGDEEGTPAKFWVADIAAFDAMTGARHMGTAMEPQMLKLKADTARKKRDKGAQIPDDGRIFDKFARTKAINKAERNALEKFIPEVVKMHLLAMAANRPEIVERIETDAEAKAREMPPPLDTPEARQVREECEAVYTEIRGLGGGKGAIAVTPGAYHAHLIQSQHDIVALRSCLGWLVARRDQLAEHFAQEAAEA